MIPLKMVLDILDLLSSGDLTLAQARDVLQQKILFERYRPFLQRAYPGRHVLVAGGKVYAGTDFNALSQRVTQSLNRPFYSESFS